MADMDIRKRPFGSLVNNSGLSPPSKTVCSTNSHSHLPSISRAADSEDNENLTVLKSLFDDNEPICSFNPTAEPATIDQLSSFDVCVSSITQMGSYIRLSGKNSSNDTEVTIDLHGFWSQTRLYEGITVRVFADLQNSSKHYTVTDSQNYLLVSPDTLVQCTSVTSGLYCKRYRGVLSSIIRGMVSRFAENSREMSTGRTALPKTVLRSTGQEWI